MDTQSSQNNIPTATAPAPEEETIFGDVVDTARFEKNLKDARGWLYAIAALQTIIGIYEYNTITEKELAMVAGLIDTGLAFVFFVLALWSKKQAYAAFTTALLVYVVINIASLVLDPSSISGFFFIKVFVVIALVKGINSAREINKLKESFGEQ